MIFKIKKLESPLQKIIKPPTFTQTNRFFECILERLRFIGRLESRHERLVARLAFGEILAAPYVRTIVVVFHFDIQSAYDLEIRAHFMHLIAAHNHAAIVRFRILENLKL